MGDRVKRIGRAGALLTKMAGLISASVLASGCSLLPFGRAAAPKGPAMLPELHEARANARPDCLADDVVTADAPAVTTTPVAAASGGPAAGCTACACSGAAADAGQGPVTHSSLEAAARVEPGEAELQRLMDGNKRFVEGEAENVYQWPQRPGEERTGRPPVAMVVACSEWQILPESAFDTRAGELFVVRIAGNAAVDNAVIESAKFAVQQYDIPLILVLGHEGCTAVKAGLKTEDDALEGRAASATVRRDVGEANDPANDAAHADPGTLTAEEVNHADTAVHANVDEVVNRLRQSDPALRGRIAAGDLTVVGAYYDETNGQIILEPAPAAKEQWVETPRD